MDFRSPANPEPFSKLTAQLAATSRTRRLSASLKTAAAQGSLEVAVADCTTFELRAVLDDMTAAVAPFDQARADAGDDHTDLAVMAEVWGKFAERLDEHLTTAAGRFGKQPT